jgi:signal transduction histidine kinase
MRDCEAAMRHMSEGFGMSIEWQIPEAPLWVALDAMMMRRVLDNLVRNAGEAIQQGSTAAPRVRVSAAVEKRDKRHEVCIRVADNGNGIPAENRRALFDPYFTTKPEGTGLGLAICKKIVLEHGGRIYLDEQETSGTVFVIALPSLASTQKKEPPHQNVWVKSGSGNLPRV